MEVCSQGKGCWRNQFSTSVLHPKSWDCWQRKHSDETGCMWSFNSKVLSGRNMDTIYMYVEYYMYKFLYFHFFFYQTLTTHIKTIICQLCNCWAECRYFGLNRDKWIGFATLLKSYEMLHALFTIMMSYCICKTSFVFGNIRAEEKWLREYFLFSVLYLQ